MDERFELDDQFAAALELSPPVTKAEFAERFAIFCGAPEPLDQMSRLFWERMARAVDRYAIQNEGPFDTAELEHYVNSTVNAEASAEELAAWQRYLGGRQVGAGLTTVWYQLEAVGAIELLENPREKITHLSPEFMELLSVLDPDPAIAKLYEIKRDYALEQGGLTLAFWESYWGFLFGKPWTMSMEGVAERLDLPLWRVLEIRRDSGAEIQRRWRETPEFRGSRHEKEYERGCG